MLLIRKDAFERAALRREELDGRLRLTADEFQVEGDLIVVGPIHDEEAVGQLLADFEERGLVYFDDYFDLSGSWPSWLVLFAMAERQRRGLVP